jgi:hypothetical protein
MRTALICGVVLFVVDTYWFGGTYFSAVRQITIQLKHQFF